MFFPPISSCSRTSRPAVRRAISSPTRVDPVNDTPRTLKQFAAKHGAGAGWSFLTGTPENVSTVLKRLGGLAARPEEHASILLIGDAVTGTWVKSTGTERPETIVYLLDHLDDELGPGGAPAGAR